MPGAAYTTKITSTCPFVKVISHTNFDEVMLIDISAAYLPYDELRLTIREPYRRHILQARLVGEPSRPQISSLSAADLKSRILTG